MKTTRLPVTKMSKTAAGITGDSYQENNLSSGAKAYFRIDYAFISKGQTITFRDISVCCYMALQSYSRSSESIVSPLF